MLISGSYQHLFKGARSPGISLQTRDGQWTALGPPGCLYTSPTLLWPCPAPTLFQISVLKDMSPLPLLPLTKNQSFCEHRQSTFQNHFLHTMPFDVCNHSQGGHSRKNEKLRHRVSVVCDHIKNIKIAVPSNSCIP